MKKILFLIALLHLASACTKHDPFDNLGEEVWILSKFVEGNVENITAERVTFLSNDTQFRTDESYYSHQQLKSAGLLDAAVKDEKGNHYRMPTAGELKMIFPRINHDEIEPGLNMGAILIFTWDPMSGGVFTTKETAWLGNRDDYSADENGPVVSGDSEFYYDENYDDGNPDSFPIYALRFKGTSQYAAYRYDIVEVVPASGNFSPVYGLRLKAKWLKAADVTTKISDLTKPSYWGDDCIELLLPMTGYIGANGFSGGYDGRVLSSTVEKDFNEDYVPVTGKYNPREADLGIDYNSGSDRYPLRLLRCKPDGTL